MADGPEGVSIQDLPDELLVAIFSMTSPYADFESIMLVCRRWNNAMYEVVHRHAQSFHRAVASGTLAWHRHEQPVGMATITERYSHSACYFDKSIYVFGGCASTSTTFNDLWRFDLGLQRWVRPLATGRYPSPKACATLKAYKDCLILFGGWSHPTPYTFHQASKFFNQLHLYHPRTSKWTQIDDSLNCPEGRAGHEATVVGDSMIVIGGYQGFGSSCMDIWVLDLARMAWRKVEPSGVQPAPRYSHAQVALDDTHILILGGCGGPNMQLADAWLLTLSDAMPPWSWTELTVLNPELAAPQLMCHPACLVGDKLIIASKNPKITPSNPPPSTPRHAGFRSHPCCGSNQLASSVLGQSPSSVPGQSNCGCHKRCHPDTSDSDNDDATSLRPRGQRTALPPRYATWGQAGTTAEAGMQVKLGERGPTTGRVETVEEGIENIAKQEENKSKDVLQGERLKSGEEQEEEEIKSREQQQEQSAGSREREELEAGVERGMLRVGLSDPGVSGSKVKDVPDTSAWSSPSVTNESPTVTNTTATIRQPVPPGSNLGLHLGPPAVSGISLRPDPPIAGALGFRSGPPMGLRPSAMRNRQRQLEALRLYEERLNARRGGESRGPSGGNAPENAPLNSPFLRESASPAQKTVQRRCCCRHSDVVRRPALNPMYVHRLDVSEAVTQLTVAWQTVATGGFVPPDETIFYSLVEGNGELVMFGGIQGDMVSMQRAVSQSKNVTNALYYLSAGQ